MCSAIRGSQGEPLRGSEAGTDLEAGVWLGRGGCGSGKGLEAGRTGVKAVGW